MSGIFHNDPSLLGLNKLIGGLQDMYTMLKNSPNDFPDLFKINLLGKKVLMIHNPEMIQYVLQTNYKNYQKDNSYDALRLIFGNGLITNEGESWRKQRTMIQPAFHMRCLERISELVTLETSEMLSRWKKMEGREINFTREMAGLTIQIICKSLFTTDMSNKDTQLIWRNLNFLNEATSKISLGKVFLPDWVPLLVNRKVKKAIDELNTLVDKIIDKRNEDNSNYTDLLQLLLDARYEGENKGMSKVQIRAEVMTLLVAGHETTVNALSWTWYFLLQNFVELDRLKKESLNFIQKSGPGFSDLKLMKVGRQIMNESMRIFPPVVSIGRQPLSVDGFLDYKIPLNSTVGINIVGVHHHPKYWHEPDQFKPERFEDFELKGVNRFIFMPFGAGPRICIGNNFAMMEMQLINAMLASHTELELVNHHIKPITATTLKPEAGVIVKISAVSFN